MWLLDRFGSEIEVDFHQVYHLDVVEMFHQRRFRKMLNLVNGLPRWSLTKAAMMDSDDYAKLLADELPTTRDDPDEARPRLRMSEYTPEAEMLCDVLDRLGDLMMVVQASGMNQRKPKAVPRVTRPRSAVDRIHAVRQQLRHDRLVSALLPNG